LCKKKARSDRVFVERNCTGFHSLAVWGEDAGDACYYDLRNSRLVGTRSFGMGDSICHGSVPPVDAACASKTLVCGATP
jgi:hypothetical protein